MDSSNNHQVHTSSNNYLYYALPQSQAHHSNPSRSFLNLDLVNHGTFSSSSSSSMQQQQSQLLNHQITDVVAKNPKKRTRTSRKTPTTVLTTDTSNFRAMVQEFTGIPAPAAQPFLGLSNKSEPPQNMLKNFMQQNLNHPVVSFPSTYGASNFGLMPSFEDHHRHHLDMSNAYVGLPDQQDHFRSFEGNFGNSS